MANREQLIAERSEIDKALNHLIEQGQVVPHEQKDQLGEAYQQLWDVRQELTAQIEGAPAEAALPPGPVHATAGGVAPRRRIRWGVLLIGGLGLASLVGLLGYVAWRSRKGSKKR